ncbi:MAG: hypothetical protein WAM74_17905 [Xanthobacteraceae bacterium]
MPRLIIAAISALSMCGAVAFVVGAGVTGGAVGAAAGGEGIDTGCEATVAGCEAMMAGTGAIEATTGPGKAAGGGSFIATDPLFTVGTAFVESA